MRTFIFDMDGTLADSMPTHQLAWDALLPKLGLAVDRGDFFSWSAGLTNVKFFRVSWGKTLHWRKLNGYRITKNRCFAIYIEQK